MKGEKGGCTMKKVFCVSLLALMLVCLLCASALAQTTGIAMDGKVYTHRGYANSGYEHGTGSGAPEGHEGICA